MRDYVVAEKRSNIMRVIVRHTKEVPPCAAARSRARAINVGEFQRVGDELHRL